MEKFGIFNILSALSDMANTKKKPPEESNRAAPDAKTPTGSFSPPDYGAYNPMLELIKKHDEISKRIDKNNKS